MFCSDKCRCVECKNIGADNRRKKADAAENSYNGHIKNNSNLKNNYSEVNNLHQLPYQQVYQYGNRVLGRSSEYSDVSKSDSYISDSLGYAPHSPNVGDVKSSVLLNVDEQREIGEALLALSPLSSRSRSSGQHNVNTSESLHLNVAENNPSTGSNSVNTVSFPSLLFDLLGADSLPSAGSEFSPLGPNYVGSLPFPSVGKQDSDDTGSKNN